MNEFTGTNTLTDEEFVEQYHKEICKIFRQVLKKFRKDVNELDNALANFEEQKDVESLERLMKTVTNFSAGIPTHSIYIASLEHIKDAFYERRESGFDYEISFEELDVSNKNDSFSEAILQKYSVKKIENGLLFELPLASKRFPKISKDQVRNKKYLQKVLSVLVDFALENNLVSWKEFDFCVVSFKNIVPENFPMPDNDNFDHKVMLDGLDPLLGRGDHGDAVWTFHTTEHGDDFKTYLKIVKRTLDFDLNDAIIEV